MLYFFTYNENHVIHKKMSFAQKYPKQKFVIFLNDTNGKQ